MKTSRRVLLLLLALIVAVSAFARVGGGESYGGGSSSSGGSGDSGGGDGGGELIWLIVRLLFWLTVEHPVVGIPVDIVVIAFVATWIRRKPRNAIVGMATTRTEAAPASRSVKLDALRRFDPNFSDVTFSDFCYSLYARAHQARGARQLDQYAPYLSAAARQTLLSWNASDLREVNGIIIGSFSVVTGPKGVDTPVVTVQVMYEANYTEVLAGGEKSWYVRERWTLERQRDILSPPPEKAKADHCPRCGAALRTRTDGSCEFCGTKIESGAFQWFVRSIALVDRQERGPVLTGGGAEAGTDRPTVRDPRLAERLAAFEAANPGFNWQAFLDRVRDIAAALQNAWTARDWEQARPLETEGLFQMHRYWIDAYRKQKLRNVVDDFTIEEVEAVKIDSDAFYESVTVRIWAHGRDYTADESGRVVGGSKDAVRSWSEYWTFIRTRAAGGRTGKIACPNCGASVTVGATGICEFCGGKLTSGTFDWLLSRIEQDESYQG